MADPSTPLMTECLCIFYRESYFETTGPNWMIHLRTFQWSAQMAIAAYIIFMVLFLFILHGHMDVTNLLQSIVEAFMIAIQKKCPFVPQTIPLRIGILTLSLSSVLIFALMKSMLSASLVVKKEVKPASSFKDIHDFGYKITYLDGSYLDEWTKTWLLPKYPELQDNIIPTEGRGGTHYR